MKRNHRIPTLFLVSVSALLTACSKEEATPQIERSEDTRSLSDFEYTRANLVGYDEYGKFIERGDTKNTNKVGAFYFLWHGSHETGIYDNTKIEKELEGATMDPNAGSISPVGVFHYWSEPLYGYYHSADPFVLNRHAELLTLSGVEYILFDGTNGFPYMEAATSLCKVFSSFQEKGYPVPKIGWYLNSYSNNVADTLFDNFYSKDLYKDLWYMVDGKPFIVADTDLWSDEQSEKYREFFSVKEAQWPTATSSLREGFPWMSFDYPQDNFRGTISVSSAQSVGMNMADPQTAWGRGHNNLTGADEENWQEGANFETQFQTALDAEDGEVKNVFVTGWNEWMAIKQNRNGSINFCDQYNEQYSRDMEMENGVLGDTAYLQLTRNSKKYLYSEGKHYNYDTNTIDFNDASTWNGVKHTYLDFEGDAVTRDYKTAAMYSTDKYTDDSARNDIISIKATHDANNLYLKVTTKDDITTPSSDDKSWMNIFLNSFTDGNEKFAHNFDYRINSTRTTDKASVEKYNGTSWTSVGEAEYKLSGKELQIAMPLAIIGKSQNECHVSFKATDHVTNIDDIMNYYVTGDSAPIGRLSYEYGY